MRVALFAGRPLWAAMMVWKLVSPSPGMLVWTSSTSGVGVEDRLGLDGLLQHRLRAGAGRRRELTWRIFSEPALMNWVGSWLTRVSEATNSTPDTATAPSAVQRERRTKVMTGV